MTPDESGMENAEALGALLAALRYGSHTFTTHEMAERVLASDWLAAYVAAQQADLIAAITALRDRARDPKHGGKVTVHELTALLPRGERPLMCVCEQHHDRTKPCTCICPGHRNFDQAYELAMSRYDLIRAERARYVALADGVRSLADWLESPINTAPTDRAKYAAVANDLRALLPEEHR